MWQLKLGASALGIKKPTFGGSKEESAHDANDPKKIAKYARYAAGVTCAMDLILGFITAFLFNIGIGITCILFSPFIVILELPYVPLSFIAIVVTFFQDYRFKVVFFLALSLPCFFALPTIFAGIASFVTCILYGVAAFMGESGKEVLQTNWKRGPIVPKSEEQQAKREQKKPLTEETKVEDPKHVEIKVEGESIQQQNNSGNNNNPMQKSTSTSSVNSNSSNTSDKSTKSEGSGKEKKGKKESKESSSSSKKEKPKGGFLGNVTNMSKAGLSGLIGGKKKSSLAGQGV